MQIVEAPLRLSPHKCVVTGREDGQLVDFIATADCLEPPRIVIKREVVEEAATTLLDMVPKKKVEALEDRLLFVTEELEKLSNFKAAAENYEQAKEAINA